MVVVAFAIPPCHHSFLLLGTILRCLACHLAQVQWKWFPISLADVPIVVTGLPIDMLLVGWPILLRKALQELLVVSRKLWYREHKGWDMRLRAVVLRIQLMRCGWIFGIVACARVQPMGTYTLDVVHDPFCLNPRIPWLKLVAYVCRGGHGDGVGPAVDLRKSSVAMVV